MKFKTILLLLMVVFTGVSCNTNTIQEEKSISIEVDKQIYYFKSLTEYTLEDGDQVNSTLSIESGSIHIYNNDIIIKRVVGWTYYFIVDQTNGICDGDIYYTLDNGHGEIFYASFKDIDKRMRIDGLYDGIEFYIN